MFVCDVEAHKQILVILLFMVKNSTYKTLEVLYSQQTLVATGSDHSFYYLTFDPKHQPVANNHVHLQHICKSKCTDLWKHLLLHVVVYTFFGTQHSAVPTLSITISSQLSCFEAGIFHFILIDGSSVLACPEKKRSDNFYNTEPFWEK